MIILKPADQGVELWGIKMSDEAKTIIKAAFNNLSEEFNNSQMPEIHAAFLRLIARWGKQTSIYETICKEAANQDRMIGD